MQVANHVEKIGMQALDHHLYTTMQCLATFAISQSSRNIPQGGISIPKLDIGRTIHKFLREIPEKECKKKFHCWIESLKRCMHAKGECFENI